MIRFLCCALKCCLINKRTIKTPTTQRGLCCKEQTKQLLTDARDESLLHCRTLNLQHIFPLSVNQNFVHSQLSFWAHVVWVSYQDILGLRMFWARNQDETWIELGSAPESSHPKKAFLWGGDGFCSTTRYHKQMMGTTKSIEIRFFMNFIFCVLRLD